MALTKHVSQDKIEIVGEFKYVQVRTCTKVLEDGIELSSGFHRHVVSAGDDYSEESAEVQAICVVVHTADVVAAKAAHDAAALEQGEQKMATTITGTTIDVGPNKLVANSAGNVGVGTASPETKLTIDSDISTTYSATGYAATVANSMMYLNNTNGGSNTASLINFRTGTGDGLVGFVAGSTNECDFVVATDGGSNGIERLRVSNAGIVTKPYQPAFSVYKSIAQDNIPTADDILITWGTEVYDVGSNFASNTFTAPVTGKYFLNTGIRVDSMDAVHYYNFYIETSNRRYMNIHDYSRLTDDPSYWSFSMTALVDMDAGDEATVGIYQGSGATQTDIATDASRSFFHGYLLG